MKSNSSIISSLILGLLGYGCSGYDPSQDILEGQIAYPFNTNKSIGRDRMGNEDRFVIRTISGPTEYVVEIPGAAQDYDVEVPVADATGNGYKSGDPKVKNPQITDRELVSAMPNVSHATQEERALMDKAYGVGEKGGPSQAPSFSLAINKINKLYLDAKYELALVEINNLLAFYPTSVRLYKMKGSVLIKTRNYALAERAWLRAADLDPGDIVIRKGIDRLRRRIENESIKGGKKTGDDAKLPAQEFAELPEVPAS